jgi:hypothetical protein
MTSVLTALPTLICALAATPGAQEPAAPPTIPSVASTRTAAAAIGSIRGLVLGPGGAPMVNAKVWVSDDARGQNLIKHARSDGEGAFQLSRLPLGGMFVFAECPGLTTPRDVIELNERSLGQTVLLRAFAAVTLSGVVHLPSGEPVADAAVLASRDLVDPECGFLPPETRSDAAGRFELRGVPIGDCVVRAAVPGRCREFWLHATADVEVDLPPLPAHGAGSELQIQVAGLPTEISQWPRVSVRALRGQHLIDLPQVLEQDFALDARGALTLTGLPTAEWAVRLHAATLQFTPHTAIATVARRTELNFAVTDRAGVPVLGRLRDMDGAARPGVTLTFAPRRCLRGYEELDGPPAHVVTDDEGKFLARVPIDADDSYLVRSEDGRFVLDPQRPHHEAILDSQRVDIALLRNSGVIELPWQAEQELNLVLQPAATIRGRAGAPGGGPIAFARADLLVHVATHLDARSSPEWNLLTTTRTDADGNFVFDALSALNQDLCVAVRSADAAGFSIPFRLAEYKDKPIAITALPTATVHGCVLDDGERPRAGVAVQLQRHELAYPTRGARGLLALTDRDGKFTVCNVPAGEYTVRVHEQQLAGTCRGELGPLRVQPGATVITAPLLAPAR